MATTGDKRTHVAEYLEWRDSTLEEDPNANVGYEEYYAFLEKGKDKILLEYIERVMAKRGRFQKWEAYDLIQIAIAEARV